MIHIWRSRRTRLLSIFQELLQNMAYTKQVIIFEIGFLWKSLNDKTSLEAPWLLKLFQFGCHIDVTVAQSICTHYSCFENRGRFVTLKKNWAPCFLKKAGCKKPRSLLFKKRRGSLVVPDPKKISGRPDKLVIRVQIDWSSRK